ELLDVDMTSGVAARIDAERLVLEGLALGRQRVVEERKVLPAVAKADGRLQRAGRKVEQRAGGVRFPDALLHLHAILQVGVDRVQAVLREAARRGFEEVGAAGA